MNEQEHWTANGLIIENADKLIDSDVAVICLDVDEDLDLARDRALLIAQAPDWRRAARSLLEYIASGGGGQAALHHAKLGPLRQELGEYLEQLYADGSIEGAAE